MYVHMSRALAEEEALRTAMLAKPHGYAEVIDRKHISGNEAGDKVRTLWEAMENFRIMGRPSIEKEIEPFEILPAIQGKHGRLVLMAGHEDMTQMESKIQTGEMNGHDNMNVVWLTVPHHVLMNTARKSECSIVIIDTNPFAGEALRLLLMQSDYYVIMAGPDRGSTNAIQKMGEMVPAWYKTTAHQTSATVRRAQAGILQGKYPFRLTQPKFLGIVLGNWKCFKIHQEPGSLTFSLFSQGLSLDMPSNKFKSTLNKQWLEAKESQATLENFTFPCDLPDAHFAPQAQVYRDLNLVVGLIGRVRNFAGHKVASEDFGIPVPFLQEEHLCWEYDVHGSKVKKKTSEEKDKITIKFFRKVYDQMAWNILALIHMDSKDHPGSAFPGAWVNMPEDWSRPEWKMGGPPKQDESFFYRDGPDDGAVVKKKKSRGPARHN
jgi:hypothetical protein